MPLRVSRGATRGLGEPGTNCAAPLELENGLYFDVGAINRALRWSLRRGARIWEGWERKRRVPLGGDEDNSLSRPSGTGGNGLAPPNVETLGYSRMSLRDKTRLRGTRGGQASGLVGGGWTEAPEGQRDHSRLNRFQSRPPHSLAELIACQTTRSITHFPRFSSGILCIIVILLGPVVVLKP